MKRYTEWVIRNRYLVIVLTLLLTIAGIYNAKNLKIIIDPNAMLPQSHPYISTGLDVERIFGSKYVVVIGITPKTGDIYQAEVLAKVKRITAGLLKTPGVVKANLLSLSARRAKDIEGGEEGLQVHDLMAQVPDSPEKMTALRQALQRNPVYLDTVVSKDGKTTSILAEFKKDPDGFRGIMAKVDAVVDPERSPGVEINLGGLPNILAANETYSDRMGFLLPIAILVLSLVLFRAFRTKQGLILPLVTGLISVSWGIGAMGLTHTPMDVFNATTPLLILAVATGHAVQMLKRYYEEYQRLRAGTDLSPRHANEQAIVLTLSRVGPVMMAAGAVASLGFFSLLVFDIGTVRTFGIFAGMGILATLVLEMTFIPALRSVLSPPGEAELNNTRKDRVWDALAVRIGNWITGPRRRWIYVGALCLVLFSLAGMRQLVQDNSSKSYFASSLPVLTDDDALNRRLGGTNTVYLMVEGKRDDAIKDPKVLQAMDRLQRMVETLPGVGKTASIADFIKRMNQSMHAGDTAQYKIPDSQDLVSQYLFLYSMSGDPGDFDAYVDNNYRAANVTVLLKTDSTAGFELLAAKVKAFAADNFSGEVKVRIGGSVAEGAALTATMVRGKILNILQIGAVVFVIASLIFRSLAAGTLVLLPLMVAVLANFGMMGWSGIPLNIATSLTSAMAVGIGADYAIYLIYRLREELETTADHAVAIRKVISTAGQSIMFVVISISAGYGVLMLSLGYRMHQWLGLLIATGMAVSALVALLLIPALILSLRPSFIFGRLQGKHQGLPATAATLLIALTLSSGAPDTSAAEPDLIQIMEKNAAIYKVADSESNATFTLINPQGQERVRKSFGVSKLQENGIDNKRMRRFLSPSDVNGTVVVVIENSVGKKDDDIWVYLPALKKIRRLTAANKKDSFIGTDFSYGDLIGYKVEDWNYKLLREEVVDGQPCYVIEAIPKTPALVAHFGYAKRLDWVRKDILISVRWDLWDEAGEMLKTETFRDIRQVDAKKGKWQAMRLDAHNVQTGHRTRIEFENFKTNQQVSDNLFTAAYMAKEQ